jgi:hypothetical protein
MSISGNGRMRQKSGSVNAMSSALFTQTFAKDPPSMVVLRWITMPLLAVFAVLASISGYRAIVQVYSVDVDVPAQPLTTGSVVSTRVASSGRVHVTLRLELVQGARAETLAAKLIPSNRTASLDPRTRHGSISVVLTPETLARLEPGSATIRATGLGRSQWLRTPPPVVREVPVVVSATARR